MERILLYICKFSGRLIQPVSFYPNEGSFCTELTKRVLTRTFIQTHSSSTEHQPIRKTFTLRLSGQKLTKLALISIAMIYLLFLYCHILSAVMLSIDLQVIGNLTQSKHKKYVINNQ